jgi:hypothetical protein
LFYQYCHESDDADQEKDSHRRAQHQGQRHCGAVKQGAPAAVLCDVVTKYEDSTQFLFDNKANTFMKYQIVAYTKKLLY